VSGSKVVKAIESAQRLVGTVKMLIQTRHFHRRVRRQLGRDKSPHWFASDRRCHVAPQPRLVFSDHSRYEGFL
jgi:hypothetical protein